MSKQSRLWCYTLNNPETPDFPDFEDKVVFAKHGEEIAPTTNTPHLQGVLYLKKKITLKGLLKTNWFSGAHWTQCRGNLEENIEYVSKEGYTHEFGQVPENPGDIGGKKEKNRWKEIIAFASDPIFDVHALAEAHPSAAVLHLDKIKKLRIDLTAPLLHPVHNSLTTGSGDQRAPASPPWPRATATGTRRIAPTSGSPSPLPIKKSSFTMRSRPTPWTLAPSAPSPTTIHSCPSAREVTTAPTAPGLSSLRPTTAWTSAFTMTTSLLFSAASVSCICLFLLLRNCNVKSLKFSAS